MTDDRLKALKNCKKCNRLFSSTNGGSLCSRCSDDIDSDFNRVREYIYDNPSSGVKDVSQNTGVDAEAILKWIREGKIVLSSGSSISFCERCDAPSDGNRFCARCVHELSQGLKAGLSDKEKQERKQAGMHIRDHKK